MKITRPKFSAMSAAYPIETADDVLKHLGGDVWADASGHAVLWDGLPVLINAISLFQKNNVMRSKITRIFLCFAINGCANKVEKDISYPIEEKYAFSYCLAEAYPGSEVASDAYYSAGVYIDKGEAGIDVYERIRAFVDDLRKEPYISKNDQNLSIMQCLDLLGSPELARVLLMR